MMKARPSFKMITEAMAFSVSKLSAYFVYESGWYRNGAARRLLLGYYSVLRCVLRDTPRQWRVLTRCRHCFIFF
jgi:hypothetical protein